jgi:hypothetical protein
MVPQPLLALIALLSILAIPQKSYAAERGRNRAAGEAQRPQPLKPLLDLKAANVPVRKLEDYLKGDPSHKDFVKVSDLGRGAYGVVEEVLLQALEKSNPRGLAAKKIGNWDAAELEAAIAFKKDPAKEPGIIADDGDGGMAAPKREVAVLNQLAGGPFIMKVGSKRAICAFLSTLINVTRPMLARHCRHP